MKKKRILGDVSSIVIKIGTGVLTAPEGGLDRAQINSISSQISKIAKAGKKVVIVSSGAVGAGMEELGIRKRPSTIPLEQAAAAVGQSKLMHFYREAFKKKARRVGQILLTQGDLRSREKYLNVRNTILELLHLGVIPIINENDTVAVDELYFGSRFGDNDILSACVTNLIGAKLLIILTDVDGLYVVKDGKKKLVHYAEKISSEMQLSAGGKGREISKGGMDSKLKAVRIVTRSGEGVIIANGRTPKILERVLSGEMVGTFFEGGGARISGRKRWIAFTLQERGKLIVDSGAQSALEQKGKSLLPGGVKAVRGKFKMGDLVCIADEGGREFARGLINYSYEEAEKIKGAKSRDIISILGYSHYDELIHRDNLVIL